MTHTILAIKNLTKTFGSTIAVDDLTLSVEQGQFIGMLGPSGCGKTTTLRLIAGFEKPNNGTIEIKNTLVSSPKHFLPPEKRSVGMVFQSYALFPHLTVAKNIAYGLPKGSNQSKRVQEVLDLVQLVGLDTRMPHELSGGQQQRVALARALAPHPALILLDEPFSNLDARLRNAVRQEVREILRQANATTIFVTHDQEEALSMCDLVAVMIGGKLMQLAAPPILYSRPINKEVATFMGDANFLPGHVENGVVSCELGRFPILNSATGPVEIMLRPEEIPLTLDEDGPATILNQQYFGHDQILTCQLDSGTVLQSRLIGGEFGFKVGQRVGFKMPQKVVVFSV